MKKKSRSTNSHEITRKNSVLISRGFVDCYSVLSLIALALLQLLSLASPAMAQSSYNLRSPDQRIEVRIKTGDCVKYSVLLNGKALLQDATLSLKVDQTTLGLEPKIKAVKNRSIDQQIEPVVRQKFARIRENYNELLLEMEGGYEIVFRVYNEGVAYRLETSLPQREVKVYGEEGSLKFAVDYNVYYP